MANTTTTKTSGDNGTKQGGNNGDNTMTLSCVLGWMGSMAAVAVVFLAVAIMVVPRVLYTDLPPDVSLDLTSPTTMIVTGANSGLGLASVMHFAHNEHATIIMACRSQTRCTSAKQRIYDILGEEVVKAKLQPMSLDLSKKESIEAFANELRGQPIHILINNAGLAGVFPDLEYNAENGIETHIHVNHLGHVRLMHCLWNNLQMAENARIVAVSSLMAAPAKIIPTFGWTQDEPRYTTHWNGRMYGGSKRANLFFANELHHRLMDDTALIGNKKNGSQISVVAAHPGFTQTDLCKNGCTGKNTFGRYLSNLKLLVGTIKMTAEDGALSQAYAAVVPQSGVYIGPSLALVGGPKILGQLDHSRHHMAFTRDESKELWDKSLKALGIEVFGDYKVPVENEEEVNVNEVAPEMMESSEEVTTE
ncbi:Short-chain dehydrogenase TIC 32, chloroplastic [Seminavis robusta]|uniref:Short-chain dehydrogenase TIC 32, chloroplastic n=1 Tax=Seminavis robusta TaxID=568900 RepID=A0A9N8ES02_9STRA|nr:Short-chain dehydrogenase TIC 32, chloroplastic [Seminavis robusta]|eukprot:Sro1534_g280480.1 Short-chain dehydrogenase TIC 32, chloroplastic (420) ;mRNA; f:14982-16241